jgi:hypothetical protein
MMVLILWVTAPSAALHLLPPEIEEGAVTGAFSVIVS